MLRDLGVYSRMNTSNPLTAGSKVEMLTFGICTVQLFSASPKLGGFVVLISVLGLKILSLDCIAWMWTSAERTTW